MRTIALAAATMLASHAARAGQVRFDVQLLPAATGAQQVISGLNDSGTVVGYQFSSGNPEQAYVFTDGTLSVLPVPGALWARPAGISNNGVVVGSWFVNNTQQTGFLSASGATPIAVLSAGANTNAVAQAIDPGGRLIAGYSVGDAHRSWI
ncbi:MAG: hypothetical protein CFE45_22120, partial [Burkholderiales bacterium PBB5]